MDRYKNTLFSIYKNSKYFEEAISYTFDRSGFLPELIEKDYYCSLILNYLFQDNDINLVFKGGTCLSKVYTNFYRMSEDLDFVIPVKPNISKNARRQLVKPVKQKLVNLINEYSCFSIQNELTGYNVSKQYIGVLSYNSVIESAKKTGEIKIEIGMREELIQDVDWMQTSTLLIDPFKEKKVIPDFKTQCLSLEEVYAEKFRAALSRREPAIRDYFDIFYAVSNLKIGFLNKKFLKLVEQKLDVPDNDPIDISNMRKKELQLQIETELKPFLRPEDFNKFDFEIAFRIIEKIMKKI
ncbi:MAG: nucleotidyl transferase AbiEii/AbiGii toxin family protein [Candidatus Cloacimonetes bacterium]|nr:nucleotidyl transferase AbiEii/AbiGii toxin family protein [Candidatus Cloacimonadota bacterium]